MVGRLEEYSKKTNTYLDNINRNSILIQSTDKKNIYFLKIVTIIFNSLLKSKINNLWEFYKI